MMSSSSTQFSTDGEQVISRQTGVQASPKKTEAEVRSYFEIERCRQFITTNKLHRVALQFPDSLLCDAPRVASIIASEASEEVFILGDTSYGSCCVDEITAEHNGADCIIHFGPSCLTRTRRLPVLFIFGKEVVDVRDCERCLRNTIATGGEEHVLVMLDTVYSHCTDELRERLADCSNCIVSQISLPESPDLESRVNRLHLCPCDQVTETEPSNESRHGVCSCDQQVTETELSHVSRHSCCDGDGGMSSAGSTEGKHCFEEKATKSSLDLNRFGRCFQLQCPIENYRIFYIGTEGPTLTNLILNYSKCQFFSYNPKTKVSRQETLNTNKALGRRYFLVQKAKEAKTVGILVGTLGAANYLKIIERLKAVLKQAGKKYYTVAVGKLNVPKMANFLEIDLYVLVACPENSLVDSQEFFKPVVTPFEMEIACIRSKEWTGDYSTDFQELLPGAVFHTCLMAEGGEEEPEFSLITGGFVPTKETNQLEDVSGTSLIPRSKMEIALPNTAAAYLEHRSWQGLEQKLGETEVGVAVEGRSGVATVYTHEPNHSS